MHKRTTPKCRVDELPSLFEESSIVRRNVYGKACVALLPVPGCNGLLTYHMSMSVLLSCYMNRIRRLSVYHAEAAASIYTTVF